jgi:endonuclease-3
VTPAPPKKTRKPARKPAAKPPRGFKGAALQKQARDVERLLRKTYPGAKCELDYGNAFELAAATILSAQCTDKRVNMVTPVLFARYPDAAALAGADIHEVEDIIRSTGFFHNKAKSLVGMARALMAYHAGEVPRTMDDLVVLPGIGRKTANVVLGNAFGVNEGIVVDTHVARVSARLGLTRETDPVKIEHALMPLFPRTSWTLLSHLFIWHGRRICEARKPRCSACVLKRICPSAGLFTE